MRPSVLAQKLSNGDQYPTPVQPSGEGAGVGGDNSSSQFKKFSVRIRERKELGTEAWNISKWGGNRAKTNRNLGCGNRGDGSCSPRDGRGAAAGRVVPAGAAHLDNFARHFSRNDRAALCRLDAEASGRGIRSEAKHGRRTHRRVFAATPRVYTDAAAQRRSAAAYQSRYDGSGRRSPGQCDAIAPAEHGSAELPTEHRAARRHTTSRLCSAVHEADCSASTHASAAFGIEVSAGSGAACSGDRRTGGIAGRRCSGAAEPECAVRIERAGRLPSRDASEPAEHWTGSSDSGEPGDACTGHAGGHTSGDFGPWDYAAPRHAGHNC